MNPAIAEPVFRFFKNLQSAIDNPRNLRTVIHTLSTTWNT
ncbi:hypothetical protein OpiT1DRAFT_01788 [Opitutaceae bacterium TAV1]|nr:hypothetical protein OpiT1DRAFT_01788 [Opitutaceae bacterium TAV1]